MIDLRLLPTFVLATLMAASTQGLSQAPVKESPRAKSALVRGWLFPGNDKQGVSLGLKPADEERTIALAFAKDGVAASNPAYGELPLTGNVAIELKSGEEIISTQNVALRGGRSYTIVGWRNGARWQIKAFSDGPSASKAAECPLRLLNFVEGRETEVYVDGQLGKKLPPASLEEIQAPAKELLLGIKVLDPQGGHPSQTSTAYDLSQADSAYLVVANDYLGRPDPRVIVGGSGPAEPAPEPQAPNLPPTVEQRKKEKEELQARELQRYRAQLNALNAAEKGPNKIPNAAAIRRQIEQEIRELQKPARAGP